MSSTISVLVPVTRPLPRRRSITRAVGDLYRHFGIDAETIVGAAVDLLP